MKKIEDFNEVQEAQDFKNVQPGPKVVKIVEVEDKEDKEYLKIAFDIAKGDMKGHFAEMKKNMGLSDWPIQGNTIKSYKKKALPFFKRFITAVEKSNEGYKFDFDEQKLVGKYFVANFGEEEYDNGSEIKTTVRMQEARSLQSLKDGKIQIPKKKTLSKEEHAKYEKQSTQQNQKIEVPDLDDLPF